MRPALLLSNAATFGFICAASASGLTPPHITARLVDDPCTRPAANASVELGNWVECQVNGMCLSLSLSIRPRLVKVSWVVVNGTGIGIGSLEEEKKKKAKFSLFRFAMLNEHCTQKLTK